ncbi:MAG: serine/threonine-protein kinase [Planctomycetaceae bacterium]
MSDRRGNSISSGIRSENRGEREPPDDPRVAAIAEEFQAQLEQGLHPDPEEYAQRYPELSGTLKCCLESLAALCTAFPQRQSAGQNEVDSHPHPGVEPQRNPLGDFQIVRELGRGGMGVVYEAQQLSLGRRVALKVLPFAATFDARQLQRFKNEAQAAALLHHTHIVPIYAVGCERGVHFYAMEFIEGQSLAVVIQQLRERAGLKRSRNGGGDNPASSRAEGGIAQGAGECATRHRQSASGGNVADNLLRSTMVASSALTSGTSPASTGYFRKIARLMIQAAEALDHAHQRGVIHRDIKPGNLLMDAAGSLWVTDFGLAQFQADTGLTRPGDLLGTFRYMSPEQTMGQRTMLDHRTDVYSLGATFYELLTLEPVFEGETRQELLYQILHSEPRAPRQINRAIPVEMETIVLKALSKNAADRYATAADLAADLQRYLDDQPILARRPSMIDRLRKWSRRHPSVVVASVLLLIVLAVALLISNRLISREQARTAEALERVSQEQAKAAAALIRAEARASEAEERFQQARRAVNMLIEVGEKELVNDHMIREERLRLLRASLNYYQDFIRQREAAAGWPSDLAAVQERVRANLDKLSVLEQEHKLFDHEMGMLLLWSPLVLDDLGLVADARASVVVMRERWAKDWKAAAAQTAGANEETRRRRYAELASYYGLRLAECLSPRQQSRIRQISIQIGALFQMKGPEVVRMLELPRHEPACLRPVDKNAIEGLSDTFNSLRLAFPNMDLANPSIEDAVVILTKFLTRDWSGHAGPTLTRFRELLSAEEAARARLALPPSSE